MAFSPSGEYQVQPRLKVPQRGETQLIGALLKLSRETHLDETRHDSEQLRRILAWIDEQLICRKFEARLNWGSVPNRGSDFDAPLLISEPVRNSAVPRRPAGILTGTLGKRSGAEQLLTETAEQPNIEAEALSSPS